MARDERKRQKNLAKKKQRENRIRKQANILRNPTTVDVVNSMLRGSWHKCYEVSSSGISNIICVRRSSTGYSACVFLVDSYCLGIKGTTVLRAVDNQALADQVAEQILEVITPAYALKKIQAAMEGARRIGFAPHPKAEMAMRIFNDVNVEDCAETFEFGLEGKPYYMPGPHDDAASISLVLKKLSVLGDGNYNFTAELDQVTHFRIPAAEWDIEDWDESEESEIIDAEKITYTNHHA